VSDSSTERSRNEILAQRIKSGCWNWVTLWGRKRPVRHRASRVMAVVENLGDLGEIGNVESLRCWWAAALGTAGHRCRSGDALIDVKPDKCVGLWGATAQSPIGRRSRFGLGTAGTGQRHWPHFMRSRLEYPYYDMKARLWLAPTRT
jgi:hypothetical protein